ncbi:2-amino-4-hydroxy-6-hydroxymethyldihydropteridine pyrophosphokinase [Nitrosococcus halophilus Nc 4]|uniref:2-amino-4-hydroxy-6-hydroxymethyldihydropteridine pyrophosphokinase n=1 Tax=Nitrosococcus halophilus (strain Nc4) TaxID=472759 RepID=D5BZ30_NITHN|nr:2-amino-4-hydroxy-6-hydroxymethyldihydropteridine diphosphokinase [Nitrosococcus halophilus]ADE14243.1 2-amino-4-hydroxy-6-hydroxymethyldihydropteridine pyrophosphokinase [Nitrosococcus halophilus Nc 4]
MVRAYIGLGSNLNQPQEQVCQALAELAALPQTRRVAHSKLYRSAPMGPQDQPDYINAVAVLDTGLGPFDLLAKLQAIEQSHHRVRKRHWGERTLDLDLLLYGDLEIATEKLTIPHSQLHERAFVLYPLAEVAPQVVVPGRGRVVDLAQCCSPQGLQRL